MNLTERSMYPTCKCGRPMPIGKRKCLKCRKTPLKKTTGRAVRKGSNARGLCARKSTRYINAKRHYGNAPIPEHLKLWPQVQIKERS